MTNDSLNNNDTPLTQAQACLEALADYRPGTMHMIDGMTNIGKISPGKINALGRAYECAQALVDTLSKQEDEPKDKYATIEWQIMACARNFRETDATPKEVGDALMQVIHRHYPSQQSAVIAEPDVCPDCGSLMMEVCSGLEQMCRESKEDQQREGLRSIREALAKGRQYCDALNANIAGAIGNDNTVVRPDLNQIDSALTRIDRMIGCVE